MFKDFGADYYPDDPAKEEEVGDVHDMIVARTEAIHHLYSM